MTKQDLKDWQKLLDQYKNGYHMPKNDMGEFIRLNHLVMDQAHDIHNTNMLRKDK